VSEFEGIIPLIFKSVEKLAPYAGRLGGALGGLGGGIAGGAIGKASKNTSEKQIPHLQTL